jgi:hypothetical protein
MFFFTPPGEKEHTKDLRGFCISYPVYTFFARPGEKGVH